MIRRVTIQWPDDRPFRDRAGRPIRLLAASDERDPSMEVEANRLALAPLDGVIGCGDLDPHWLAFLADAFSAPLVYVRGNHDQGGDWDERDRVVRADLRYAADRALPSVEHVALHDAPFADERAVGIADN